MTKLKTFLFLLFFPFYFHAQYTIQVLEQEKKKPISGANIYCNQKMLGTTDESGNLQLTTKCAQLKIKAKGYYDEEVLVEKKMKVYLSPEDPKTKGIEMVVIADKSDSRALAILKKVNERFDDNSPKSLPSYSYKSYEKISVDFDQDSIASFNQYTNKRLDSLKNVKNTKIITEKTKKDSLEEMNFLRLMQGSKLFMWERAMEFLWDKNKGEKSLVLDNRVAGLHQPFYEMLTLRSNRNKIPREIKEENRKLYRFFLTDSAEIDGRKTWIIRFRPAGSKSQTTRRKFTGILYIDQATYAVKKIEHNSKVKNEGYIASVWAPFEGKWFLKSENLKIKMGKTSFDDRPKTHTTPNKTEDSLVVSKKKQEFGNYIYMKSNYFDFQSPITKRDQDFEGYSLEVKNTDGSLLDKYRTDTLSYRERNTYDKIDSIGKKYKIDQKVGLLSGAVRGKLRLGMFNFDIPQLLKFNGYEGFRATLAVKFNERLNKYISPDFYVGYGFKDQQWKYGIGVDVKTSLQRNAFFRAEYFDDVMAAGRFNEYQWNMRMGLMNSEVDLNNDKFFHFKGFKFAYEYDLTNALTINTSIKKQSENALFTYNFNGIGSQFNNVASMITLKYSPNAKNIMTPSGKFTFEENYPDFIMNYEQGWKAFGGDLHYSRWDFLAVHHFKTKIGVSGIRLYGGITQGDTPIWHHFMMNGLGHGKNQLNYNLTSYLGFATMQGGKYFNDRFVGTYITHRIPWYFTTFGKNISSFDVVYRGIIGDMKNKDLHQFEFQKLNHLYQEVGVEWNNFMSTQFNVGFFYRVGHYATTNFNDNFALQLKFKFLGF